MISEEGVGGFIFPTILCGGPMPEHFPMLLMCDMRSKQLILYWTILPLMILWH